VTFVTTETEALVIANAAFCAPRGTTAVVLVGRATSGFDDDSVTTMSEGPAGQGSVTVAVAGELPNTATGASVTALGPIGARTRGAETTED
jgi:hypothetical protein